MSPVSVKLSVRLAVCFLRQTNAAVKSNGAGEAIRTPQEGCGTRDHCRTLSKARYHRDESPHTQHSSYDEIQGVHEAPLTATACSPADPHGEIQVAHRLPIVAPDLSEARAVAHKRQPEIAAASFPNAPLVAILRMSNCKKDD